MKIRQPQDPRCSVLGAAAFTVVEVVIAIAVGATLFTALFAAMSQGVSTIELTRQDLRATQILVKKMEGIRLCTYEQVTNKVYNPTNFIEYYAPALQSKGIVYTGTVSATTVPANVLSQSYRSNMLLVTVSVAWNTGKTPHRRSLQSFVARDGIANYIAQGK